MPQRLQIAVFWTFLILQKRFSDAVTVLAVHKGEIQPPSHALGYTRGPVRGRFGRNTRPRGRNFALYWSKGESGSLPKKKKKTFFFFSFDFASCKNTIDKV